MIVVGIDTGGTFTDFIFRKGDDWAVYKCLSTPDNPAEAILGGLERVAGKAGRTVVHGSTVATNAILERKGVVTALVTTRGFEDIIEIGRQNRTRLYDLAYRKEPHIVPQSLRFGVPGRIDSGGRIIEEFDSETALEIARQVRESGAESAAVCFLFSFLNPDHEARMKGLLEDIGVAVSASHEILSEFREYERTSTTVINAYVSPKMKRYLGHLSDHLGPEDRLRIMQSNGGSISAETAMRESVRTILSGPAGGAVGAWETARTGGFERIISFDMGGTSTDVSLMDGSLSLTLESSVSNYPVKVPMVDIHTVGAGGGSIAVLDPGGALRVGPESAGADPGPVCYGKGSRITVTDADLFLGRLIPDHFLGGHMRLKTEAVEDHFRAMAKVSGLSPLELAEGILAVVNTSMEKAIRVISVERGHDVREFALLAFGGAGGLHSAFLARLLNIPRVLIPAHPGILSAMGMLMADVIKDYSLTVMLRADSWDREDLENRFRSLEERGFEELEQEGIPGERTLPERFLDMRYKGQSYEIVVPYSGGGTVEEFHRLHEKRYGYRKPATPVELVNLRLRVRGVPTKPSPRAYPKGDADPPDGAVLGSRKVVFDGRWESTRILRRDQLLAGNRIPGPAVVVEYSATTVIPPACEGRVDSNGNLVISIE